MVVIGPVVPQQDRQLACLPLSCGLSLSEGEQFCSGPHPTLPTVDVCSYVLMHLQVCPGISKLYNFFLKLDHFNSSVCT